MTDDDRLLTFQDLKIRKRWPFSPDHTRRLWLAGKFPKPFKAAAGSGTNMWRESDIDRYFAERAKSARG